MLLEGYKPGELIAEGKTKRIWTAQGNTDVIIAEYKDTITAHNDPQYTREFDTKGQHSNTTNCHVFKLLEKCGILTAFKGQVSKTAFAAERCNMIPLEVVARGRADGKYTKRFPETRTPGGEPPMLLPEVVIEFYLKTTNGRAEGRNGNILVEGLLPEMNDPWIINPLAEDWELFHPALPPSLPEANLGILVKQEEVVPNQRTIIEIQEIFSYTFLLLQDTWQRLFSFNLIDMKGEFGFNDHNILLLCDVIDNDSWRLRDEEWKELSKEGYRQGKDIEKVEKDYELVARLVEQFSTLW